MQQAADAAKSAADKMKEQASQQAQASNMPAPPDAPPMDAPGADGPKKDGSKANDKGKPTGKPDKSKHEKGKNVKHNPFEDEGEDDDWFKMKSESETGAEVDSLDDVPSEYRGLVREYFNVINKGGKR